MYAAFFSHDSIKAYVEAGGMKTGFYVLEKVVSETERAISFEARKFNKMGNEYKCECWLPKSQLQKMRNDFYVNSAPEAMYLVRAWLYDAKANEGYYL